MLIDLFYLVMYDSPYSFVEEEPRYENVSIPEFNAIYFNQFFNDYASLLICNVQ